MSELAACKLAFKKKKKKIKILAKANQKTQFPARALRSFHDVTLAAALASLLSVSIRELKKKIGWELCKVDLWEFTLVISGNCVVLFTILHRSVMRDFSFGQLIRTLLKTPHYVWRCAPMTHLESSTHGKFVCWILEIFFIFCVWPQSGCRQTRRWLQYPCEWQLTNRFTASIKVL